MQIATKKCKNLEGWSITGQVEGGLRKKCKIKRVGALRGGLQKKWKITKVGSLRGRLRVDCEKSAKLRRLGN